MTEQDLIKDPALLKKYSSDASLFEVMPLAVAQPRSVQDLKDLVHLAKDAGYSLTARSAGTDMTGGPLTTSIVVDMMQHFNHVKEITSDRATTEPGVFYRDFEKETLKYGLLLPCYPASRELCAMGGIIANNSGGEKTLTYGKTEQYVQQIKMVCSDGEEHTFHALNQKELSKKLVAKGFEGELYRTIHKIVEDNYELLKAAKPNVSKNSAGYYLWNVWDPATQIFDMTKLIVGSQGTLGIVTEATFRLIRPKQHSTLLVIMLKDLSRLAEIVAAVLKHNPESFESYDDHTMKIALRYLPDFIKLMGAKNLVSLAFQFLPEAWMVLTGGAPKLILEAEFTGDSEDEIYRKARSAQADLKVFGLKTHIAKDDNEEKKYWTIRRESFNLLRHHVHGKHTAPFIDDIVVRPEHLPQFLPRLNEIMSEYDLIYTIAGHIGDGNFHIIPLMNLADPKSRLIIPELSKKVYDLVFEFKGSMDGEHNDGLIRSPFLKQMYGEKVYALFEATKKAFDPDNIFNPGKKVNSKMIYALEHLTTQ